MLFECRNKFRMQCRAAVCMAAVTLCTLLVVTSATPLPSSPATKIVYLGKSLSVPFEVPVFPKDAGGFSWSQLTVDVIKGTAANLGSTLGYSVICSVTGNLFGLLDKKPDTKVTEELKKIEELVRTVDYKVDMLAKDVAKVQISVQLGNVKLWGTDVQSMFDTMVSIFENAPYQSHSVTKDNINRLVDVIKRKAYEDALGIYQAMAVPTLVEEAILTLAYRYVFDTYVDNTDALDMYGIIRAFSTQYASYLSQASTLLKFAANATKDAGTLSLALKVDGFITAWDEFLETGEKPVLDPLLSEWARAVLRGSPDETKIGWNANFYLDQATTSGAVVGCGGYIWLIYANKSPLTMRRSTDGTWYFSAPKDPDSTDAECVFLKDKDNRMVATTNTTQGSYLWNVYWRRDYKGPPHESDAFHVRGYASWDDKNHQRNEWFWGSTYLPETRIGNVLSIETYKAEHSYLYKHKFTPCKVYD